MRLAGLDLNLLLVLDALFAEMSVTRAGERIHLSQSATSAALARLRHFFNDELLIASGNRMILTPKAIEIRQQVRDIILRADDLARDSSVFRPASATRHFRLTMSDFPATVLIPRALAKIRKVAPGLTFEIRPIPENPAEDLERAEVDLLVMPQQFISSAHPSEQLFEDRYVCVVCADNGSVKARFSREQYLESGHVGVRFPGQSIGVLEEWLFEQLGARRRVEVVVPQFTLMPHFVVGTERVATVHSLLAREFRRNLPVRIVAPPIEMPRVVESIQWHKYRASDSGLAWVRSMLRSSFARHPQHR